MIAPFVLSLLRDPEVRAELVGILRDAAPPAASEATPLLTASQLAKRLGISVATVRRLDPPHVIVGDAKTRRFDLDAVRAFLVEREPAPTTPKRNEPDVDVSGSLARAGLRSVGGR